MSKESEALNYLVNLAVVGNKENNRGKVFTSEEIILQALKRNRPVRLLALDDNYDMVEAKSVEDYHCDEWYCAMGYCPICGSKNPISSNFCRECGNKLDNDWEGK